MDCKSIFASYGNAAGRKNIGFPSGNLGFLKAGDFGNPTRTGEGGYWAYGRILCIGELGRGNNHQRIHFCNNELFHDKSFIKIII